MAIGQTSNPVQWRGSLPWICSSLQDPVVTYHAYFDWIGAEIFSMGGLLVNIWTWLEPTIWLCASSYQVHHLVLHVHTYSLDSLKMCFEDQSNQFQYC